MDKNAIKKFAVWARRDLIERVMIRAKILGLEEKTDFKSIKDFSTANGKVLSSAESNQYKALVSRLIEKGYKQVIEEVAYTWFNRFTALRFMEVNGYLPSHIRVFTDESNNYKPQILDEAINLDANDFPGMNMQKIMELKQANKSEELYKYLLILQCNALNSILPNMFQQIEDYTELLVPDGLLFEGSVIHQLVTEIPEYDWKDAVQIIGWMYQYYNTEPKDLVFEGLKKNIKITKENIPAATQLFTPDWIVRYMVENSLGRLWLEGHQNSNLKSNWKYYLDEAEQEPEVKIELEKIREEYKKLKPEDIKCIDPCMGSGHILCYIFDVLEQIYEEAGYNSRDAVESIVKNNLFGLDIDERAAQLAYFAVMMKARQYDRRFFSRGVQPKVYAIKESNNISPDVIDYFCKNDLKLKKEVDSLLEQMKDSCEYGSLISVSNIDFKILYNRVEEIKTEDSLNLHDVMNQILPLIQVGEALSHKYDAVVTNPPYMRNSGMNDKLCDYVTKEYLSSKYDLFSCFIERCKSFTLRNSYFAMITQHAFMFLPSYETLRCFLQEIVFVNMAHLGAKAFDEIGGEVVQTTSFVACNMKNTRYNSRYSRLVGANNEKEKENIYLNHSNEYIAKQEKYEKIPGMPIAYWMSDRFIKIFENERVDKYAISDGQTKTGNNEKYLRLLWEVDKNKLGKSQKWVLIAKGGSFRRWYGNIEYVIDWSDEARTHYKKDHVARIAPGYIWFREGLCWNHISSSEKSAVRIVTDNMLFETAAPTIFFKDRNILIWLIGFYNSKVSEYIRSILNPTLSINVNNMTIQPIVFENKWRCIIENLVDENLSISKIDWDAFETSWDFTRHPLVRLAPKSEDDCYVISSSSNGQAAKLCPLAAAFAKWLAESQHRFYQLKKNEEELNRIFIDIYGLQDELTPDVEDKDVTVRQADLQRDIKSLISYCVGIMFGRYSLDVDGLAYAGGDWDSSKYKTFIPDDDNIIPICDNEYFDDDIVGRFVEIINIIYGEEHLEENLNYIAEALGGKGSARQIIRNYFLNDFFNDHCKIYQKRPIYWLFDSGKKNGFKCLIYMHRYQTDTIARIRTDYVHAMQAKYRLLLDDFEHQIEQAEGSAKVKLTKAANKFHDQAEELRLYEEKIHHLADSMISIDLDDGVKHNYALFQSVLAKIK